MIFQSAQGPLGRREMAARWELLGNAVTVPVARWIGDRLAQPYKYKCALAFVLSTHSASSSSCRVFGVLRHHPDCVRVRRPPLLHAKVLPPRRCSQVGRRRPRGVARRRMEHGAPHLLIFSHSLHPLAASRCLSLPLGCSRGASDPFTAAIIVFTSAPSHPSTLRPFAQGDGRHSAEAGVGEFPVFVPFTRLGDFVRELGPPPPKEAVTVYLQRMEEKGWHIASEARRDRKAHGCLNRRLCHLQFDTKVLIQRHRAAFSLTPRTSFYCNLPHASQMRVVLEAAAQGVFETSRGGGGGGSGGGKHPREPKEKDADELSVFFEDPGQRRLVWAKYATHPWWPALVVDLEADYVPPRTLQSRRSEDHVLVVFFGDGAWQWCARHSHLHLRSSRPLTVWCCDTT